MEWLLLGVVVGIGVGILAASIAGLILLRKLVNVKKELNNNISNKQPLYSGNGAFSDDGGGFGGGE